MFLCARPVFLRGVPAAPPGIPGLGICAPLHRCAQTGAAGWHGRGAPFLQGTPSFLPSILPPSNTLSFFFQLSDAEYVGSFPLTTNNIEYPVDSDETRQEILTAISHLSNFISAESASRTLKRCVFFFAFSIVCCRFLTFSLQTQGSAPRPLRVCAAAVEGVQGLSTRYACLL